MKKIGFLFLAFLVSPIWSAPAYLPVQVEKAIQSPTVTYVPWNADNSMPVSLTNPGGIVLSGPTIQYVQNFWTLTPTLTPTISPTPTPTPTAIINAAMSPTPGQSLWTWAQQAGSWIVSVSNPPTPDVTKQPVPALATQVVVGVGVSNPPTPNQTMVAGKDIQLTHIALLLVNTPTPTLTPVYVFISRSVPLTSPTPTPFATAVAGHYHSFLFYMSSNNNTANQFFQFQVGATQFQYATSANSSPARVWIPDYTGNLAVTIVPGTGGVSLSGYMMDSTFPPYPGLGYGP